MIIQRVRGLIVGLMAKEGPQPCFGLLVCGVACSCIAGVQLAR